MTEGLQLRRAQDERHISHPLQRLPRHQKRLRQIIVSRLLLAAALLQYLKVDLQAGEFLAQLLMQLDGDALWRSSSCA